MLLDAFDTGLRKNISVKLPISMLTSASVSFCLFFYSNPTGVCFSLKPVVFCFLSSSSLAISCPLFCWCAHVFFFFSNPLSLHTSLWSCPHFTLLLFYFWSSFSLSLSGARRTWQPASSYSISFSLSVSSCLHLCPLALCPSQLIAFSVFLSCSHPPTFGV